MHDKKNRTDDSPPLFGSWKIIYSLVIIELIILITLFFILTKVFS
ncbi:MAG: hypothetical protein PHY57_02045 [Ignavibacterium sp.]|jgi:hypothetical protein|nr:hypothetical protein [Ignavibacterium sp.]MDX9712616.1 hypothetical protein [Ignavibacteriaceae bacterium]MEB2355516.1 hypothetical protein [Ignavibacteriales bacterium]HMN18699.1 hypothetical protein [Ignavibacteriaceae bacterium]HOJ07125.1 hypothetical protein [Ignavibacteriaceae bacterium]